MNIPNILTLSRFIFIPIFGYCLHNKFYMSAVLIFLLAGATDVLDGYIARKFDLITSWGKLADPLADKLIEVTALVILTAQHLIPFAVVAIFATKELFMILGGALLYKRRNIVVSSSWYGKLATGVFYIAIVMIIFTRAVEIYTLYTDVFIVIALLSTIFAFFMYAIEFTVLKGAKVNE